MICASCRRKVANPYALFCPQCGTSVYARRMKFSLVPWEFCWTLAAGVWAGNWLVVPLLGMRTFRDGFFIGLIAAVLTVVINLLGSWVVRFFRE